MPYYINFSLKETGKPLTCQQVDLLLANHFGLLKLVDDDEWFFNWYDMIAFKLAIGDTMEEAVARGTENSPANERRIYWESSVANPLGVNYIRIAWVLYQTLEISTGYTRN